MAIPALVKALEDSESSVRMAAAAGLGGIGFTKGIDVTIPALIQALNDPTAVVRVEAIRALDGIGMWSEHEALVVKALRSALKDSDERVRQAANEALEYAGY
jgi:vesicle coat complex subunit